MGLFGNTRNEPMHYGEIFNTWSYLHSVTCAVASYQTMCNHAGGPDLRAFLTDAYKEWKEEVQELEALLKPQGIALPPAPPERAEANLESIPAGARMNDNEIAMAVQADVAAGIVMCSQMMVQCVREDIAAMFAKYHATKAALALRLLRLNKEKGWLVAPPPHVNTPELARV